MCWYHTQQTKHVSINHVLIPYPTEETRVYKKCVDNIPNRENTCPWTISWYHTQLRKHVSMNHIHVFWYCNRETFVNEPYLDTIPIRETLVNKPLTLYLNILKLNLKEKHLSIKYPTEKTFVNETYLILYQSNNCYWNQINFWIL